MILLLLAQLLTIPEKPPRVVLVLLETLHQCGSSGGAGSMPTIYYSATGCGQRYVAEPFQTVEDALKRLNPPYRFPEVEVIGLYELGKPIEIELHSVEHVEPVRVEERRWTEKTWRIKR